MIEKLKLLIYIVDDSEVDLKMMGMYLRSDTFEVKLFTDPDRFKEALNNDVSMVITDIKIGNDYDVYKTVEQIKRDYPGIYVIVVSGYLGIEEYKKLINCHVWHTVEKSSSTQWLDELKLKVELTVPKMLNKRLALTNDY